MRLIRSLLITGVASALLGALVLGALWVAGSHWSQSLTREIEASLGTSHPQVTSSREKPNARARHLERVSAALGPGFDLTPPQRRSNVHETSRLIREMEFRPWDEAFDYWHTAVTEQERAVSLSPDLAGFLEDNRDELEQLKRGLLTGPVPLWEFDARTLDGPEPPLFAHLAIHKLFSALSVARAREGELHAAEEFLLAGWRLNQSIRNDPVLISQLVAMAQETGLTITVRSLDLPAGGWPTRLREHDYRHSLERALLHSALRYSSAAQAPEDAFYFQMNRLVVQELGIAGRYAPYALGHRLDSWAGKAMRPYVRLCALDRCDRARRDIDRVGELPGLCDRTLEEFSAAAHSRVHPDRGGGSGNRGTSWWNLVGEELLLPTRFALERLTKLELQRELALQVLELRSSSRESGVLPSPLETRRMSTVCRGDHWIRQRGPDGTVRISFSRELGWKMDPYHLGAGPLEMTANVSTPRTVFAKRAD